MAEPADQVGRAGLADPAANPANPTHSTRPFNPGPISPTSPTGTGPTKPWRELEDDLLVAVAAAVAVAVAAVGRTHDHPAEPPVTDDPTPSRWNDPARSLRTLPVPGPHAWAASGRG